VRACVHACVCSYVNQCMNGRVHDVYMHNVWMEVTKLPRVGYQHISGFLKSKHVVCE